MAKLGLGTHLRQGMQQRQDMVLAPRMLQSIEVLALPRADLETWLAEEVQKNEALVVGSDAEAHKAPPVDGPSRSRAAASKASDDHRALLEAQPDRAPSLVDAVEEQLRGRDLDPELSEWVRFLVGCLNDGGLLLQGDEELVQIAESAGVYLAGTQGGHVLLARAIAELQQLEPAGIGARSPVEALLLQLDPTDEDYALLCTLLEDFLVELSKNHRPQVAQKLGLELLELDRLLGVLGALDTRPAAELVGEAAPVLHPDVIVHVDGDAFSVELARGALPAVGIDPTAEELLSAKDLDSEARRYLRSKVDKARWVQEAVHLRGVTLLRVAEATLRRQVAFLQRGPTALEPLLMTDLASELELAVSTVSRTVGGKHVQTPFGIVPLRTFFQSSAGEGSAQGASATEAVRERVRQMIEAEDPKSPLSDEAIVQALGDAGTAVARRTVAKYRKELGIPSSYRRKRHG